MADDEQAQCAPSLFGDDSHAPEPPRPRRTRYRAQTYPDGFHIGFHLEGEAAVHGLYERMTSMRVDIPDPPSVQRGALGFYFTAPGEILVEVAYRA